MRTSQNFEIDEEGFVKIVFVPYVRRKPFKKPTLSKSKKVSDSTRLLDESLASAEKSDTEEVTVRVTIPQEFKDLADKKQLTVPYLLGMEYTSLLRSATYGPAKEYINNNLQIRGVPLMDCDKNGKPYKILPHQIRALSWMKNRENIPSYEVFGLRGGIVCLTMGLGKTLTAMIHMLTSPKGEFPNLVVCSKTVKAEWKMQFENFFGTGSKCGVKVLYFHKDDMPENVYENFTRKDLLKYDVVVTTYDVCLSACKSGKYNKETYEIGDEHTMMKDKKVAIHLRTQKQSDRPDAKGHHLLFCTPWERVICDESQKFIGLKVTYECIMALYGKYKWCLTGTPIKNYSTDVWAQLRYCGYIGITKAIEWKRKCYDVFASQKLGDSILTMSYKDAGIVLPPKSEYTTFVKLEGKHDILYKWVLGETISAYDKMLSKQCTFACVLALFTALRQTAIAPYLFTAVSKRKIHKLRGNDKTTMTKILKKMEEEFSGSEMYKWLHDKKTSAGIDSCKIKEIMNIVNRIPKTEKILIFSNFTSCLDLVADAMQEYAPDIEYVQLDGDMTGNERVNTISQFKSDPNVRVMLISYKVGSEGLNLVEATHCICIEPWWTNAVHNQAKARLWRMGQTKEVHIHNVYVRDSIEQRVVEICKDKDEMADSFLQGTEKPVNKKGLDTFTLGQMLGVR